MKRLLSIFTLSLLFTTVFSQEKVVEEVSSGNIYLNLFVVVLGILVVLLLWVALALLKSFKILSKEFVNPTPYVKVTEEPLDYEAWKAQEKSKPGIWSKLLSLKPLAEEEGQKLEHEFDGIVELDNPTPAWFNWLFYSSIVLAIGYMFYYHVLDWGPLQEEEYAIELAEAKEAKIKFLAKAGNAIDENSVKEETDAAIISAGAVVYKANCMACHGDKGQGTVGPNLTDEYWLHGGSINNVFKTIKYGVPEKGMISWEKSLSPKQISDVSNFIKSLKGTNPPNPKEPQGPKEG